VMRTLTQSASGRVLWVAFLAVLVAGCDVFMSTADHLERARAFIAENDYRSAVVELKNVLQEEPENPTARLLLAESALWLGDPVSAEAELKRVSPNSVGTEKVELQARLDLAMGRPQAVLDALQAGTGSLPEEKALLYRGLAQLGLGDAKSAEQSFRRAVELDPRMILAKTGISEALAMQGFGDRALAASAEVVSEHQESAWAWYSRGILLARVGELELAGQPLDRARELMAKQLDMLQQVAVLSALADLKLATGDIAAARDASQALGRLTPGSPFAMLLSSRIAIAEGNYVDATAELRRIVNSVPSFTQARFMLAVSLLAQGNLEQASQQLNEVVTQNPAHLEARQLFAQVRMRLNDPDGALRALVPALQATAGAPSASGLVEVAQAMAAGNDAAAREKLEKIRSADPNAVEVRLMLARLALARDDSKQASVLVDEAIGSAPLRGDVRNSAGLMYLGTGRYDQAVTHFRAATELSPRDATHWLNLGRAQLALEMVPAARVSLTRALELRPKWVAAAGTLAFLELQSGQGGAALARAGELKAAWPRDPAAFEVDGEISLALRRYAESAESFLKAMELQPESPGYAVKAYRARSAGQLSAPLEPLERWVAAHPKAYSMRALLAEAYGQAGQRDKAIREYEQIVASQPDQAATLNNLAWLYYENGDAKALETARLALAKAPGNAAIMDTLGWILLENRQIDEGVRLLRDAAAAPGAEGEIHYHYAVSLSRAGQKEAARVQLRRTLADFPRFQSRDKALRLLEELGTG
jgi:Tfp pilus assembly protein PilF